MKLEIDFSGLAALRTAIGAKVSTVVLTASALPALPKVLEELLTDGLVDLKNLNDIAVDAYTGLLHVHGHQVVLYIPDQNFSIEKVQQDASEGKKYHLAWCQTLGKMKNNGRFERYTAYANPDDKQFRIYHGEAEGKAKLLVCQNCLAKLGLNLQDNPETFNLKQFLAEHQTYFSSLPQRSTHTMQANNYSKDWHKISQKKRTEAKWTCQRCGLNLLHDRALLHVHHINGRKDDNADNNLRVLCVDCHAKEPDHQHLKKNYAGAIERIKMLRNNQGLGK